VITMSDRRIGIRGATAAAVADGAELSVFVLPATLL
jgi:hypothetical protein